MSDSSNDPSRSETQLPVDPDYTKSFLHVCREEAKQIERRREVAASIAGLKVQPATESAAAEPQGPTKKTKELPDLVGLALSGGGIRSASVGLGVLQALHRQKHLLEVDYLSTVSGGGYIGSYLSSAAVSSNWSVEDALSQQSPATCEEHFAGQPPLVQRFIFGGKYLYRPWEAANKYLIGLFFNNLLLLSGLVTFAALIALIWRSLDYDGVRDFLDLFHLNSGVFTAFLPCYFFLGCWITAWIFSYFKREAEAPGTWAQRFLYFMLGSFLVGLTVLLVNPETKVGFLRVVVQETTLGDSNTLIKWLLGLVAAGLAPFLAPKKLLKFGQNRQSLWQQAIFHFAMFALLVGVPLAVVGLVALPNISDTAVDRDFKLRPGDVRNWPGFLSVMERAAADFTPEDLSQILTDRDQEGLIKDERLLKKKSEDLAPPQSLIDALNDYRTLADNLKENYESRWSRFVLLLAWPILKSKDLGKPDKAENPLDKLDNADNPLGDLWAAQRNLVHEKLNYCKQFNDNVLSSPLLPFVLLESLPPPDRSASTSSSGDGTADASAEAPTAFQQIRLTLLDKEKKSLADAALDEAITDAQLSYRGNIWSPEETREFNLRIFWAMHPECFFDKDKTYRDLVIVGDQMLRVWILGIAFFTFLAAAAFVDLNSTSLHRFYRNRLRQAYFVPSKASRLDGDLFSLCTTEKGYPYHLINATINLARPRFLDQVDAECAKTDVDRREVQTFTFSQLFCGCDATGWASTQVYETFRTDNISFADAVALSGSPSDPLRGNSLGLAAAMSALNLTLGQWMPNPCFKKPPLKPNFFMLLWDWLRKPVAESRYCYLADGGFTDNLGIISLLRRRCRLIIAFDASSDAKGTFVDLNWVIRTARIRFGIEITQPGEDRASMNTFPLDADAKGKSPEHYVLARIRYPDSLEPAWLLYLKPSFDGDEGADLLKYRLENTMFPNDDTFDQFYEPARVESYRQLGFHIAQHLCSAIEEFATSDLLSGMTGFEQSVVERQKPTGQKRLAKERRLDDGGSSATPMAESLADGEGIANDGAAASSAGSNSRGLAPPRTGDVCGHAGKYESQCECKCFQVVTEKTIFPPCPDCREPVIWLPHNQA